MNTISVVIPVYYNEGSLPVLFEELKEVEQTIADQDFALELIFVDDGSGDNSFRELMKIKEQRPQTRVVKLTRNFGAVHASKAGLRMATGDCFLILAADLQDPPSLIPTLLGHWKQGKKFIACIREDRDDPVTTRAWASIYYKLLRRFVVSDYPQGGFDLALMDKAMLPFLQQSNKNINPSLFAYWLGFEPTIIRYSRRKRIHGKSRWTFSKKLTYFIDSLLGFSILPIRMISFLGIFISLASFIYGVVIIINTLLGKASVSGFPTIVTLLAFLLGLIIIMLGVIGEYLWRVFDEVNQRPEYVIDEVY
ncbi:MAG: glycosyltransferase family 2 protein [Syntrophomonadaceae bacterium]